jgi:hypothetical protein
MANQCGLASPKAAILRTTLTQCVPGFVCYTIFPPLKLSGIEHQSLLLHTN